MVKMCCGLVRDSKIDSLCMEVICLLGQYRFINKTDDPAFLNFEPWKEPLWSSMVRQRVYSLDFDRDITLLGNDSRFELLHQLYRFCGSHIHINDFTTNLRCL